MASLLKYCHGLNHKISFLLLCWRDYPQDLICHFYFMEKRDRSRYFAGASLFIPCWMSQVIKFVDGAVSAERILILRTCKNICVDRNRRPAMTFFEKSKQAKQSKTEGGSTLLVWHYKTRPRNLSESRHSMNLRNVKLFRAVMHDELEMSIYVNGDLVFGSSSG